MQRPCGYMSLCLVEGKEAYGRARERVRREGDRWAGTWPHREQQNRIYADTVHDQPSLTLQPQHGSEDELSLVIRGKPRGTLADRGLPCRRPRVSPVPCCSSPSPGPGPGPGPAVWEENPW